MTDEARTALERCQDQIDYEFSDPDLLVAALTHASIAEHRGKSNERLEFLGDAVLALVVCQELYDRYPDWLEGDLTKIKSAVVSRRTCAEMSRKLGLCDCLLVGKGMTEGQSLPGSLSAAAFESIVAAIHIDGGLTAARDFILAHISEPIAYAAESAYQRNFKSQLQQHAQKELGATPSYELVDEKGPDHSKCFEVAAVVMTKRYPSGWGPNKKEAEQRAAFNALVEMEVLPAEPYE